MAPLSLSGRAFPKLASLGDNFSFGVIADTHIRKDGAPTSLVLARTISELNGMSPQPAFVVLNGDLVGNPTPAQFAAFTRLVRSLRPQPVLVHGNHDGRPPLSEFKQCIKAFGGPESAYYSFDAGRWHFVALPSAFASEERSRLLDWLDADLKANRSRPTMAFVHFHLLPAGLTQLEFYTYEIADRLAILETLTRYGNVRYVFSGHVHNGIQTAVRTAWSYKGAQFILCPTGVAPRPFGEEYPAFAGGVEEGGYYMVVQVRGSEAVLTGRLNGIREAHAFPKSCPEFKPEIEPRWFRPASEIETVPQLVNGSFEKGLSGWRAPYRYVSGKTPGFVCRSAKEHAAAGTSSAYLRSQVQGWKWAADELIELYQTVQLRPGDYPVLQAAYRIEEADSFGGGYLRAVAYKGKEMRAMMVFDWGKGKEDCKHLPRSFAYSATTERARHNYLIELGKQRRGMFWSLPDAPGVWHRVRLDLRDLFDRAVKTREVRSPFEADKLFLAVGVWDGRGGKASSAFFDDVVLTFAKGRQPSTINGHPVHVTPKVFETTFGWSKSPDEA